MNTIHNDIARCAGKTQGDTIHTQCQQCQRKTVPGCARQVHFLPPVFIADKCPMRRQA